MKGNDAVIAKLNEMLADELTAISQYMVHSEMCANWGYGKLHEQVEKRAITEMKHAEKLIARIIFLDGAPIVSKLNPIHIGLDVEKQLKNDLEAELIAVNGYNEAAAMSSQIKDYGTHEIFETILADEEDHVDWIESQLDLINQMGLANYLLSQTE